MFLETKAPVNKKAEERKGEKEFEDELNAIYVVSLALGTSGLG